MDGKTVAQSKDRKADAQKMDRTTEVHFHFILTVVGGSLLPLESGHGT